MKDNIIYINKNVCISILVAIIVIANAITLSNNPFGSLLSFSDFSLLQHSALGLLVVSIMLPQNDRNVEDMFLWCCILGSMSLYRYAIAAEFFLYISLSVNLLKLIFANNFRFKLKSVAQWIFVFFFLYILILSMVGLFKYSEVRAVRYILISIMMIGFLYSCIHNKNPFDVDYVKKMLFIYTLYFNFLYLVNALIISTGVELETLVGIGAAGVVVNIFLYIFSLPVIIARISEREISQAKYELIALVSSFAIIAAADTRFGIVLIFATFLFWNFKRTKRLIIIYTIGAFSMSLVGLYMYKNPLIPLTLAADLHSTNIGQIKKTEYYGKQADTMQGDGGRIMLLVNALEMVKEKPVIGLFGRGAYAAVYEGYDSYFRLLKSRGYQDSIVNYTAFGTPPRPPSLINYIIDYGVLSLIGLLAIVFLSIVKNQNQNQKVEFLYFLSIIVVVLSVAEQLTLVALFMYLTIRMTGNRGLYE